MASGGEGVVIESLVGTNQAGEPYTRSAAVESQIRAALSLGKAELVARSRISDKGSPAFLQEECLVYLVRAAYLRNDLDGFNTATELLLRRCMGWVKRSFWSLGVERQDIEDEAGELTRIVISEITSEEGSGDFYQVRFWPTLKRDLLNVYDRYARRLDPEKHDVSLSEPAGDEAEADSDDGTALEEIIGSGEDLVGDVERRLLIAEALAAIRDPRHREAFVLHHLAGWQIEAKDAADPSISRRFDVTPRTVQNWLRAAESDLAIWRAARPS